MNNGLNYMNVLILDNHPIFRAGLVQILNSLDMRLSIREARAFDEFTQHQAELSDLDLVLADLAIFEPEPMQRVSTIVDSVENIPVVMVSEVESREYALEAINLGAQGFIPKSAQEDEFAECLRLVLDGLIYLSKRCLRNEPSPVKPAGLNDRHLADIEGADDLTNRQRDTLALLAKGGTTLEIGEALGISEKTVRVHISSILKALKTRNRTEAALIANRAMGNTSPGAFTRVSQ